MLVTQKRSWPIQWDKIDPPTTEHEAAVLLVECAAHRVHIFSQIANMAALGATHVPHLVRRCVSSHSALIGEFALGFRERIEKGEMSAKEVVQLALQTDLLDACVFSDLIWIEKDNGKKRPAFRYSEVAYRVQRLARIALTAAGGLHPNQFLLAGGVNAAAAWMAEQMKANRVVTLSDFPSFFLTVNRDRLREALPFKGDFLSGVLFDPLDQFVTHSNTKDLPLDKDLATLLSLVSTGGSSPQRGVPPGNALSSVGAEHALHRVLRAVEKANEGVRLATYSDNIAISATTGKAARAAEAALISVVAAEFGADVAGVLHQRMTRYSANENRFWLGRNFFLEGKKVRQRLNAEDIDFFAYKIEAELGKATPLDKAEVATRLMRSVVGWSEANKFDPHAITTAQELVEMLQSHGGSTNAS